MPVKRDDDTATIEVIDRVSTGNGELVLRCSGGHYEIISNGVFLMDTRDGASERLLVDAAADAASGPGGRTGLRLLIGGLGVGFSLGAAVAHPAVGAVTVVEREEPVIAWQRGPLAPFSGHALRSPDVTVRHDDLLDWAFGPGDEAAYDALCLDVDNGPDWTVTEGNRALYGPSGLRALRGKLAPGGVLAVWSAAASPAFERALGEVFAEVRVEEVPVRVPRGVPDVVFLAC
ncbi:spermidine synthase [Yinghuangia seranimata]|uniref:spermidine synthase n=1 Tax=Yinghuangia seranimata TaxID=408067 RepID=UPI00248AB241|nr:spermidine synthase [Yinghuangia seranimata]MDI2131602.1 spermidine synthase [Yinghuangia seranimata]